MRLESPGSRSAVGEQNPNGGAENSGSVAGGSPPRKRKGGKVPGYIYFRSPKEARALVVKAINRMLVGDVNDEHFLREKDKYERGLKAYDSGIADGRFDLPLPEKPTPPKLNPAEVNALSGAIRTWLECQNHDLAEKAEEILETNRQLLKLLEERRNQGGGGNTH